MATGVACPLIVPQFFDNKGLPCVGGSILTQVSGINTATYADIGLTTPLPNPLPLNSRGEISTAAGASSQLFLTPNVVYTFIYSDALGNQIWSQPYVNGVQATTPTQASLGLIIYPQVPAESNKSVTPTSYIYPPGNAWRYLNAAQIADVQAGTLTQDCTTGLQSWIKVCESLTQDSGLEGYLPAGSYKRTATLTFTQRYIRLRGAGMFTSQIASTGIAGDVFATSVGIGNWWNPTVTDMYINADATSGYCFNASSVANEVYCFEFRNLFTTSGSSALFAPNIFAGVLQNWIGYSYNDHTFKVNCGPGILWNAVYASVAGPAKAGFRLCGTINMQSCNGLDTGDYWGIFGQNTAASDGFQNDFPGLTDYPSAILTNCNIEQIGPTASSATTSLIMLHNAYKTFEINGGIIDRHLTSAAYHSMIRAKVAPFFPNGTIKLNQSSTFLGGAPPSASYLYADQQLMFEDVSGSFNSTPIAPLAWSAVTAYVIDNFVTSGGHIYRCILGNTNNVPPNATYWVLADTQTISYFLSATYNGNVPTIKSGGYNDIFQDSSKVFSGLTANRLDLQTVRYLTGTVITVTGAAQTIDVTGKTKVTVVTSGGAASITKATFNAQLGGGLDYNRNGDLIIECTDALLTINHSASGADTFKMSGAGNVTGTLGQVFRFCRSVTGGNWWQV